VSECYQGETEVKLGTVNLFSYDGRKCNFLATLMFVDPCIILQFIKKYTTRCNSVSELYYSLFIRSSTRFGRQTAHHQEPKTALAASGFSYVEGRWTCSWWTLSGTVSVPDNFHQHLMMGSVSSEKCWASYKYGIIKFWYTVASCGIFLYELSGYLFVPISYVDLTAHLMEYCAVVCYLVPQYVKNRETL